MLSFFLRARCGRLLPLAAAAAFAVCLLPAGASAKARYPGVKLNPPGKAYEHSHSGSVFVRVYCPAEVFGEPRGFCTGTMTLTYQGREIGSSPFAVADYDGPSVDVALAGWFRAKADRAPSPLPVKVTMDTHDLQGVRTVTSGQITIAPPPRGREPGDNAPPLPAVRPVEPPREKPVPAVPAFPGVPELAAVHGNPPNVWGTTAAGLFGGGRQAFGGDRQYDNPGAVAVDENGLVYVADTSNNRIQIWSPSGQYLSSFGSYGFDPGAAREIKAFSQFNNPVNLVVRDGRAFVVDQRNDRVMVWSVRGEPRPLLRIGRRGSKPGRMVHPWDVAIAGSELLVVDQANYRIDRFTLGGKPLGSFGEFGTSAGKLQFPFSIDVAPDGRIFVLDEMRNKVLVYSAARQFQYEFGVTGATVGKLNRPQGLALDAAGRVVIANTRSRRADRYAADGTFLDSFGYGPDDRVQADILDRPVDVALDRRDGALYVADAGNQHKSGRCGRFGLPAPDPCRGRRFMKYMEPGAQAAPDAAIPTSNGAAAVRDGTLTVSLDPEAARVLAHVKVAAAGAAGASGSGKAVQFPLASAFAQFGSPAILSSIESSGQIAFSGPDGRASAPGPALAWTKDGPKLSGDFGKYFKASLADVEFSGTPGESAVIDGIGLSLTGYGAQQLNRSLHIDVFSRAYRFGQLSISMNAARHK